MDSDSEANIAYLTSKPLTGVKALLSDNDFSALHLEQGGIGGRILCSQC